MVTVIVAGIQDNGIDVTVQEGIPGFIRKSELSRDRSEQRPDRYAIGDKLDAKITNIDKASRRVVLSVKARELDEEKKAMADFGSSDSGASLGDILGAALSRAQRKDEKEKKRTSRSPLRDFREGPAPREPAFSMSVVPSAAEDLFDQLRFEDRRPSTALGAPFRRLSFLISRA